MVLTIFPIRVLCYVQEIEHSLTIRAQILNQNIPFLAHISHLILTYRLPFVRMYEQVCGSINMEICLLRTLKAQQKFIYTYQQFKWNFTIQNLWLVFSRYLISSRQASVVLRCDLTGRCGCRKSNKIDDWCTLTRWKWFTVNIPSMSVLREEGMYRAVTFYTQLAPPTLFEIQHLCTSQWNPSFYCYQSNLNGQRCVYGYHWTRCTRTVCVKQH